MKKKLVRGLATLMVTAFSFGMLATGAEAVVEEERAKAKSETTIKEQKRFVGGELIIKYKKDRKEEKKKEVRKKIKAKLKKQFKKLNAEVVELDPSVSVEEAMVLYASDPDVEYVEPNYIYKLADLPPNDRYLNDLWGLSQIDAINAWGSNSTPITGSESVVVAIIDSGVDYNHPDLKNNIWENSAEIDGVLDQDEDGNGYTDDFRGWDATRCDWFGAFCAGCEDVKLPDNDPMDDNDHGTHVAGTIGAEGDNDDNATVDNGAVGVNWNVKILPCRAFNQQGLGTVDDVISCLDYIDSLKNRPEPVNIVAINNSWGGFGESEALKEAVEIQQNNEILFIKAAGNDSSNVDKDTPFSDTRYLTALPNVINVAATDQLDEMADFSNYGQLGVQVGAPGVDVLSTVIGGEYDNMRGTSMAAPHVTGLAALLKAADPSRNWIDIRNLILSGGDDLPALDSLTVSGKRINANGSLNCSNSQLFAVSDYPSSEDFTSEEPLVMSVYNIDCAAPNGEVTISSCDANSTVTLMDDGAVLEDGNVTTIIDQYEGDGIYSGLLGDWEDRVVTLVNTDGQETYFSNMKVTLDYEIEASDGEILSSDYKSTPGDEVTVTADVTGICPGDGLVYTFTLTDTDGSDNKIVLCENSTSNECTWSTAGYAPLEVDYNNQSVRTIAVDVSNVKKSSGEDRADQNALNAASGIYIPLVDVDLALTDVTLTPSATNSSTITIDYTAANFGVTRSASQVRFYLSKDTVLDTNEDTFLNTQTTHLQTIWGGNSYSESHTVTLTEDFGLGPYYIIGVIEGDKYQRDDQANNTMVVPLSSQLPVGQLGTLEYGGDYNAYGWALDPDDYSKLVKLYFYIDGPKDGGGILADSFVTNYERQDVNDLYGTTGDHGFLWTIPVEYRTPGPHTLYVYAADTLGGEPFLLTNAPMTYEDGNAAEFISQSVPAAMIPGQMYEVSVTMKNTGGMTWSTSAYHRLGAQNPQDNTNWGYHRVDLEPGEEIAYGEEKTFTWNITAPATGTYNFQWQMVQETIEWFGEESDSLAVTVQNNLPVGIFEGVYSIGAGYYDHYTMKGYVYDPDAPVQSIDAEFYIDGPEGVGAYAGSLTTAIERTDGNDYYGITGSHGFEWTVPVEFRTPGTHTVYAYGVDSITGEKVLIGSPDSYTVAATDQAPFGTLDSLSYVYGTFKATGWALDKDNHSENVDVHFYVDGPIDGGGTFAGSLTTDIYRSDVSQYWASYGDHGFEWIVPQEFMTDGSHSLYVYAIDNILGEAHLLTDAPMTYSPPIGTQNYNPNGAFDYVWAHTAKGWAIDLDVPTESITVEFYFDGPKGTGTYAGSTVTSGDRPDVNALYGTTGTHAFSWLIPVQFRTVGDHEIYAYGVDPSTGESMHLGNSPQTYSVETESTTNVQGSIDGGFVSEYMGIWGHAFDADASSETITLEFYIDGPKGTGTFAGTTSTTILHAFVNEWYGITGNHGYGWIPPNQYWTPGDHTIYAYGLDTSSGEAVLLGNSPTTFTVETYMSPIGGVDDMGEGPTLDGWAFDPNSSGDVITIEFYIDGPMETGTYAGSTTTTVENSEVNTDYGITGAHGFSWPIPSAFKTPGEHTVYAYATKLIAQPALLMNSPQVYTIE